MSSLPPDQQRRAIEALVLLHPLQLTDLDIISFIDAGDRELPLPQYLDEAVQEFLLIPLHPQREHLHGKHIAEAIHRKSRQLVRFPENQAAAVIVFLPHHLQAVIHRIRCAALPEGCVEGIIRIRRKNADGDFRVRIVETASHEFPLLRLHTHDITGFDAFVRVLDLRPVDPRVSSLRREFRSLTDDDFLQMFHSLLHFCNFSFDCSIRTGTGSTVSMDDADISCCCPWKSDRPFLFSPHPARKKIPTIGQIDGGDLSFLIFQMRCEITSFRPYRPAASEA